MRLVQKQVTAEHAILIHSTFIIQMHTGTTADYSPRTPSGSDFTASREDGQSRIEVDGVIELRKGTRQSIILCKISCQLDSLGG